MYSICREGCINLPFEKAYFWRLYFAESKDLKMNAQSAKSVMPYLTQSNLWMMGQRGGMKQNYFLKPSMPLYQDKTSSLVEKVWFLRDVLSDCNVFLCSS